MKIYLASSWRNRHQQFVVSRLRNEGFEVYDFRNPPEGAGFGWSLIETNWDDWSIEEGIKALDHPEARKGFQADMQALKDCDACVMLTPCGVSASMELGWAAGAGKLTVVLVREKREPELMFKIADYVTDDLQDVIEFLKNEL